MDGSPSDCSRTVTKERNASDILRIEKLGGFAGFGGPNLKSEGECALADLSPADQERVEALFRNRTGSRLRPAADGFRYRITRSCEGAVQSVEVPEELVPQPLIASVRDSLR